ncbi:MAG: hypothetical protein QOG45_1188 [Chloroflexota bacterium]|nr:hypothetical protein [Chloroflexota bacterium]
MFNNPPCRTPNRVPGYHRAIMVASYLADGVVSSLEGLS